MDLARPMLNSIARGLHTKERGEGVTIQLYKHVIAGPFEVDPQQSMLFVASCSAQDAPKETAVSFSALTQRYVKFAESRSVLAARKSSVGPCC